MALLINDPRYRADTIGMPDAHAEAFRQVAMSQRCVIMSRATGPTCLQLLEQGYDTKGYRIHGKSCDWGPMAGFVLRDPRLNKGGTSKEAFNRKKHDEALNKDAEGQGWKASVTPLKIYSARIDWLRRNGKIVVHSRGGRLDGTAIHDSGITLRYSLIKDPEVHDLWGVYVDESWSTKFHQEKGGATVKYDTKWGRHYEPLLAMTNPSGHRTFPGEHYLNAITGDYDLFAVWPYVSSYDPEGADHRPLGTTRGVTEEERRRINKLERDFTKPRRHETLGQGTKLGNITDRIYMVCQMLNSVIGAKSINPWGSFPRRNVLWHSDESARPFLEDVDLPIIAFTPKGNELGITTIEDFKLYIGFCCKEGIKVTLSSAWTQDPTPEFQNRLGRSYESLVPSFSHRLIVPRYYNR